MEEGREWREEGREVPPASTERKRAWMRCVCQHDLYVCIGICIYMYACVYIRLYMYIYVSMYECGTGLDERFLASMICMCICMYVYIYI